MGISAHQQGGRFFPKAEHSPHPVSGALCTAHQLGLVVPQRENWNVTPRNGEVRWLSAGVGSPGPHTHPLGAPLAGAARPAGSYLGLRSGRRCPFCRSYVLLGCTRDKADAGKPNPHGPFGVTNVCCPVAGLFVPGSFDEPKREVALAEIRLGLLFPPCGWPPCDPQTQPWVRGEVCRKLRIWLSGRSAQRNTWDLLCSQM